jgi:hypothetical protein
MPMTDLNFKAMPGEEISFSAMKYAGYRINFAIVKASRY